MARVALRWGVRDLASAAGVGTATITRAEAAAGVPGLNALTLLRIKSALEAAGAEFTPDGGVRMSQP